MDTMTSLTKILKAITIKSTPRTSAELKADLAKISMPTLEANVDEIERQRRALLLSGSDDDLRANKQNLDAANLEAERAQAAIDELQRQIAEAEGRERIAAIDAQADESRKAKSRLD